MSDPDARGCPDPDARDPDARKGFLFKDLATGRGIGTIAVSDV
jgi:hypothetical protein